MPFSEAVPTSPLLDHIHSSADLKRIPVEDLHTLTAEVRKRLIQHHREFGGHFASSLGVAELTTALHYVYDTPQDKVIWDTGHQAYGHKLLTGRQSRFGTIRTLGGLKPFPCPKESPYDGFLVGHAGTAVSAATGIAWANQCYQNECNVIAVVGDGALNCGLTFEALNHAGSLTIDLTIILNCNGYSISPCTGALATALSAFEHSTPDQQMAIKAWFECLGFTVWGFVDGHHLALLIRTLSRLKQRRGKHLLLLATQKGKGYTAAEYDPIRYHATSAALPKIPCAAEAEISKHRVPSRTGSEILGKWAIHMAQSERRLQIISPAMMIGSGLQNFAQRFPEQSVDVGIAESHAVTLAGGMAIAGLRPIVAVYSTFLQRSYDQVIHDIAIPSLPVIFAIDRAGLVGEDGETHQGAFDLAMLNPIPNFRLFTPSQGEILARALDWSYHQTEGPIAIRYPKRPLKPLIPEDTLTLAPSDGDLPRWLCPAIYRHATHSRLILLNFGALLEYAIEAAGDLDATVIDIPCTKPFPWETLNRLLKRHPLWVTLEEGQTVGGIGQTIAAAAAHHFPSTAVLNLGLPERFIGCASVAQQLAQCQLDARGLYQRVLAWQDRVLNDSDLVR